MPIIKDCQENGQFDYTSTGHVANVGLMAQKAEGYGSHDKTFEIPTKGKVVVTDDAGNTIFSHEVEQGDIWRMCHEVFTSGVLGTFSQSGVLLCGVFEIFSGGLSEGSNPNEIALLTST